MIICVCIFEQSISNNKSLKKYQTHTRQKIQNRNRVKSVRLNSNCKLLSSFLTQRPAFSLNLSLIYLQTHIYGKLLVALMLLLLSNYLKLYLFIYHLPVVCTGRSPPTPPSLPLSVLLYVPNRRCQPLKRGAYCGLPLLVLLVPLMLLPFLLLLELVLLLVAMLLTARTCHVPIAAVTRQTRQS